METAFMSGTPVPIYVRRKKVVDIPKKSSSVHIEEVEIKPPKTPKTPKPPKTPKVKTPKPPKPEKSDKRKKITKGKKESKGSESEIPGRISDSSGPRPRSLIGTDQSRSSAETYNTLWPLGAAIDPITRPASSQGSFHQQTAASSTLLLPPTPSQAHPSPPPPPLSPAPPRPSRSPPIPSRPLEAIGNYTQPKRPQHASLFSSYSEPTPKQPSLSIFPQPAKVKQPHREVDYSQAPFNAHFYEQHIRPLKPRTLSESNAPAMESGYVQSAPSGLNPSATYQHIQDMAAKRVSTLDYLRKTHEGRVYWFNTLLFNRNDISRLPSFDPKKLARRAHNFLILGLSLPLVLDLTTMSPLDFLKSLNALLIEFEAYQSLHPADGSNASSLSRARLPQMFKRSATTKARRASSAADIGGPLGSDTSDIKSIISNNSASSGAGSIAPSEDLMPGEQYNYLVTPSIPFDPDFFEVFASLCDVLIDCYMRITSLISSPDKCGPGVAEVFAKTDARLRKVIVAGIVKEFEDATRAGVKTEITGVSKVVLGGLM